MTQPPIDPELVDIGTAVEMFRPAPDRVLIKAIQSYEFQNPLWLYELGALADLDPWQGDLVPDAQVAYIDDDGATSVIDGPAIVVSTSCDAVRGRDPVATLAPVFELDAYIQSLPAAARVNKERAVRENRVTTLIFLPAHNGYPDSYVNLSFAGAVSTEWLAGHCRKVAPEKRLRLSVRGWYVLVLKLALHYSRSEKISDPPRR